MGQKTVPDKQILEAQSNVYDLDLTVDFNSINLDSLSQIDGKNYALIIAEEDYKDKSIRKLDQPVGDCEKLKKVLNTYYTFDDNAESTIFLKNPSLLQILNSLKTLSEKITAKDNILIFYAGHGYYDEKLELGYWLPSDAKQTDRTTWLSNSSLRDYLKSIKSHHTLLIADACFSGSIFKTRNAFMNLSPAVRQIYELPSRKAMTSGTLKEVPDKSVFVEYLVKRLTQNPAPYLAAEKLFYSLKEAVISNSPNGQIPQFGEIAGSGNEGGDFIFFRKKQ